MICDIVQTKSGFSAEFKMYVAGKQFSYAKLNNNVTFGGSWEFYIDEALTYKTQYKFREQMGNIGKKIEDKKFIPFEIYNGYGEQCGLIFQKETGGFFLSRYPYYEMQLNNLVYTLYAVGMGKEGMKFPIYREEKQVALIEKSYEVHNNLDQYRSYALTTDDNMAACLLCLYIDSLMYSNRGQVVQSSVQKTYKITTNKELKSKYNPDFIRNINPM